MLLFMPAMTTDKSNSDVVKSTGMGVIYITFAKLWFMAMGWALVFVLPRLFEWAAGGDAAEGQAMYGMYGLVITGISFVNNGIVTGTIQSVSRFTAQDESAAATVRRKAFAIMAASGLIIAGGYALMSGVISKYWFVSDDESLATYMQLSAIVIAFYACYAVFIGTLNGQRRFRAQAMFDIGYTTLKIGLTIGFVLAGFKVLGTVLGFIAAATMIAIIAAVATRRTTGTQPFDGKKFLSFAWVIIAYTFILNLVMMIDLYVLSGFVPKIAMASGMSGSAVTELMKIQAGHYKAVQQLAFIPYQAVIAIAFVVFPLVSKVAQEANGEVAGRYISRTLRFTLILIAGLATVFCGVADGAMNLVFPKGYAVAAPALRVLSLGIIAFGLLVIANTVLNAAGRKWHAMISVLVGMAVVLGLDSILLATAKSVDASVLTRTAFGTALAMLITLVISLWFVYKQFKAQIPWMSLIRVAIAAALAIGAAQVMPGSGKLITLVHCIGVLVVYFGILAATREFNSEDVSQLKQVMRRKKAN
ncbi:MAG: polysaccharide biosynthesis C-terminal domain-containing protein [Deltaproteobacteria bacterium]|nr:polysaccharide biosynthesis C-terminal domain-containing protein [Deltaproteobacteria bacterium]